MIAVGGSYSIHILAAGDMPRFMPWKKPARQLTWYLLVCSLTGEEQIIVDGQHHTIAPGQSYLIAPGVVFEIGSVQGNRPIWIHFEVASHPLRAEHAEINPYATTWEERKHFAQPAPREVWGVDLPVVIPEPLTGLFAQLLPRLVRQWKQHAPLDVIESQHYLATLLTAFVAWAWREQATSVPQDIRGRIARAEAVARESLSHDFGVPQFAAAAGYSRSRFSVLYHQHTGRTPGQYLRSLRMEQAEVLLRTSTLAINEIGAIIGYHDPTVFGRVFRQTFDQSPTAYRDSFQHESPPG